MARTDITLRADKGSALTFDEMDVNFSSFFYSASALTVDGANKLRLYYTGSSELASPFNTPDYIEVLLPTAEQSEVNVSVPGSDRQVIFNSSNSFGASSAFIFTQDTGEGPRLGVGSNPSQTLDITSTYTGEPTIFNLNASSTTSNQNAKAFIQFRQGGSTFAQLGKRNSGNNDIDFFVKSKLNLGIHNYGSPTNISKKLNVSTSGVSIGNGIDAAALSELSVKGDITIGSALQVADSSYIGPSDVSGNLLPSDATTTGLLIQSPKGTNGGNVIIGINTDSSRDESFSVVKGIAGSYATDISPIATFKADGKIGFNQRNPKEILHVEGNITGSGNIQVEGTATIKDIDPHTVSDDVKTLVATAGGTVQFMDAAPIPKGGIIMWSGTVANIPTGWSLCNGGSENGVDIPDLRNRFIVGANQDTNGNATSTIGGAGDSQSGGATAYTPAGGITINKLTTAMVPRHTHMHLDDDHTYVANVTGYGPGGSPSTVQLDKYGGGTGTNNSAADINGYDADSNNSGNRQAFHTGVNTTSVRGTTVQGTNPTVPTGAFSGTIATIVPPYYALAFIIYVGVE